MSAFRWRHFEGEMRDVFRGQAQDHPLGGPLLLPLRDQLA